MNGSKNLHFVDFVGRNLANAGIECALAYNPKLDIAGIQMEDCVENNIRLQVEISNAVQCAETKHVQKSLVNFFNKTFMPN